VADRPSFTLCDDTVNSIVARLQLAERPGPDGGPLMTLTSPMTPDPVGMLRLFERDGVCTLVYVGLTVAMIGLDSHMLFAFTPEASAVPHFTLDSVQAGGPPGGDPSQEFAFHLDMIPRVDPGVNHRYLEACYVPLNDVRRAGMALEGLTPANLEPLQWQVMSCWMMANRANLSAFTEIADTVAAYRDHWFGLVENGVPVEAVPGATAATLTARDRASRDTIFNPEVDHVWERVTQLVGEEQSEAVRNTLRTAGGN